MEQSGGIGFERLWNRMARNELNELNQERAAVSIGTSRRYYLSGAKPIPLAVWLACVGWEAQRQQAA